MKNFYGLLKIFRAKIPGAVVVIPSVAIITIIILSALIFKRTSASGRKTYILLTEKAGLLISGNNGESWESLNRGLPEKFIPLSITGSAARSLYLLTLNTGIYKLERGAEKWKSINSPLFLSRKRYAFPGEYRKISAFSINDSNPDQIILATKHAIFISHNGGKKWSEFPMKGLHKRNYITSLCITGSKPEIYAGTSFKGMFKYVKGKFVRFNKGFPVEKYSRKTYFHEEITHIHADNINGLYAGFDFGVGLYTLKGGIWHNIKLPGMKNNKEKIYDIKSNASAIYISSENGIYRYQYKPAKVDKVKPNNILNKIPEQSKPLSLFIRDNSRRLPDILYHISDYSMLSKKTIHRASGKKAVYSSAYKISGKLKSLIKTIKSSGLNSIVIDMKDDFGYLYYPTKIKTAMEIRSAKRPLNIKKILSTLKRNNIYVIARVVVFKDRALFRGYGNKYAIWNFKTQKPWRGTPRERWVDPHSEFVMKYNIAIAVELEKLGFDEIQFDYIRFPTDGPTHLCYYRFKNRKDIYKSEVLSDFLQLAKKSLNIPVSVDIYGFNAWYKSGNWMGQDIEEFSNIVDAISPMVYPSHFGSRFFMKGTRVRRPFRIISTAGFRANRHVNRRAYIRPYLQAFKLLSPTWGPAYIKYQVDGAIISGCSGFIFWNAGTDYRMVERALRR